MILGELPVRLDPLERLDPLDDRVVTALELRELLFELRDLGVVDVTFDDVLPVEFVRPELARCRSRLTAESVDFDFVVGLCARTTWLFWLASRRRETAVARSVFDLVTDGSFGPRFAPAFREDESVFTTLFERLRVSTSRPRVVARDLESTFTVWPCARSRRRVTALLVRLLPRDDAVLFVRTTPGLRSRKMSARLLPATRLPPRFAPRLLDELLTTTVSRLARFLATVRKSRADSVSRRTCAVLMRRNRGPSNRPPAPIARDPLRRARSTIPIPSPAYAACGRPRLSRRKSACRAKLRRGRKPRFRVKYEFQFPSRSARFTPLRAYRARL